MVEPIIIKGNAKTDYRGEGPCCICGKMWTIDDFCYVEPKITKHYLDGAPKTNLLESILPPIYCKGCNNVSYIDSPATDIDGNRDKINDNEYKSIADSNEPLIIKQLKMAIYRDSERKNFYEYYTKSLLELYWYYDEIGDLEQRNYYIDKVIDAIENRGAKIRFRISNTNEKQLIKKHFVSENLVLADIYRRMGKFEKALNYIEKEFSKIIYNDKNNDLIEVLNKEIELCKNKDSERY